MQNFEKKLKPIEELPSDKIPIANRKTARYEDGYYECPYCGSSSFRFSREDDQYTEFKCQICNAHFKIKK